MNLMCVEERETSYLARDQETVQGDIASRTLGNDQLAQFAFDAAPDQWMRGEILDA